MESVTRHEIPLRFMFRYDWPPISWPKGLQKGHFENWGALDRLATPAVTNFQVSLQQIVSSQQGAEPE